MTKIKAGNIYMCLKDISGYDSFTKGKVYSSIYDNALINDNHIEVKVMNSECFRIATDKEVFKAKLDWLKEETYIGLSEHDNGVETGRMEVINALYRFLDSMQEEPKSDDYNPYKVTIESISEMCVKYGTFTDDRANDFANNIKVKCKDAIEFEVLHQKSASSVWHDASEIPKFRKEFLAIVYTPTGILKYVKTIYSEDEYCLIENDKWAYIDDILKL